MLRYQQVFNLAKECFAHSLDDYDNFRYYPNKPKLSDIQVITLSIVMELCDVKSENRLYSELSVINPSFLKQFPDRTNFNRRRKALQEQTDDFSKKLSNELISESKTFIVDSTPISVCRFVRRKRLRIMQDDQYFRPKTGYLHIDKRQFHGFKLHLATDTQGVIANFVITPANTHDVKCLEDLSNLLPDNCLVLGDKGYVSKSHQLKLYEEQKITVKTPKKVNQRKPEDFTAKDARDRRRIETVFSQLKDKLSLTHNFTKTAYGFFTRITAKIAAFTVQQYLNFIDNKPIGKVFFPAKC